MLIAIEEHWMLPALTSALEALPPELRDDSLAFNEMGDHRQRLEDLGTGRLETMDPQGIDVSIIALTPPGTHPLPAHEAVRLERGRDRLIFSTDYPFQHPTQVEINAFLAHFSFDGDCENFSSANVVALFGLDI